MEQLTKSQIQAINTKNKIYNLKEEIQNTLIYVVKVFKP